MTLAACMEGSARVGSLKATCQLSRGAGTIGTALAETPCGLINALSMIASELFNIQFMPEMVVTRLFSVSTLKKLYKHRQVYRTSPSPNKGSLSVSTPSNFRSFLLFYSILSIVSGSFGLPSVCRASHDLTYGINTTETCVVLSLCSPCSVTLP